MVAAVAQQMFGFRRHMVLQPAGLAKRSAMRAKGGLACAAPIVTKRNPPHTI